MTEEEPPFFSLLILEQCPNLALKSSPKLSVGRKKSKSLPMTTMKMMKPPRGRLVAERLKTLGRGSPRSFSLVWGWWCDWLGLDSQSRILHLIGRNDDLCPEVVSGNLVCVLVKRNGVGQWDYRKSGNSLFQAFVPIKRAAWSSCPVRVAQWCYFHNIFF